MRSNLEICPPADSTETGSIKVVNSIGLSCEDLALGLLEQSEDCIKILSVDGRLEFMNCGGLQAMEISDPGKVIGKLWWDLWPENAKNLVRQKFRAALENNPISFEANCPTAKGTHRRWNVNLKPLCARNGTVVSVLVTSRDITGKAQEI